MVCRPLSTLAATRRFLYLPPLRPCKDLHSLRRSHARLVILGAGDSDDAALAEILRSYASFRQPDAAIAVFRSSPDPGTLLWNSAIQCLNNTGQHSRAITFFVDMRRRGVEPDNYTFTFALKACAATGDLAMGARVHEEVDRRGLNGDTFIATGLVHMYSKLGSVEAARQVFDSMPQPDAVTWNAMIAGYSQSREPREAVQLFKRMQFVGVPPNFVTFLNLFPSICQLSSVDLCSVLHGLVVRKCRLPSVSNGLIDAYCKCGCPEVASKIFDAMGSSRDGVSWGSMISGYAYNGCFAEALAVFDDSRREDIEPNNVLILGALSAAAEIGDLDRGMAIHDHLLEKGMDLDVQTATKLVTMYAMCGNREKAEFVFVNIPRKDVVAWSAMISAFAQMGHPEDALCCFRRMLSEGVVPNQVTISSVLPACAYLSDLGQGKSIHCYSMKFNVDSNVSVSTALVAVYTQCGLFASAQAVFDRLQDKDTVTWNAMINGYAEGGYADIAVSMFKELQRTSYRLDRGTLVGLLLAFGMLSALHEAASAHGLAIKYGLEADLHVKNATIDMYAKCGGLLSAEELFSRTKSKEDVISWNTMISGYMHSGQAGEAIYTFNLMRSEDVKPNSVTLVSIIPAVAFMSSLRKGLAIHSFVIRTGFLYYVSIGNSLIDMYAKCGRLNLARELFDQMVLRDTVSWNVLLFGYSIHGLANSALALFSRMDGDLVRPDSVSFINVLSACRHGGLLAKGRRIFKSMSLDHNFQPNLEHYACMVDLLSRAGCLDEAWDLIDRMPMAPDSAVWGAFLGGCRAYSNVCMGEVAFDHLVRLEPQNPVHYVVLSSIYAHSGRWAEASRVRAAIRIKGVSKTPGCSWVELKSTIHAFKAGDQSHPQYERMRNTWNDLQEKMESMGYVPDTSSVLYNVEREEKDSFLYNHSERLAMSFALANTEAGMTIQIVKNLRVCGDCHTVTKLVSKITGRKIIVRDSSRFHHFENGACSCNDFW